MKKYLALVRLLFVQQYKSRVTTEQGAKKKRAGAVALYVLLAICFAPVIVSVAVAMYFFGKPSGANVYIGTFLILVCQGLVLMFGVPTIISNVFTVKDADKLLYLPVRAHVIFLAKLTVAYLNELITTVFTVIAVLLPFGIGASVGFGYYLMTVCALFLIPMLPMLLAAIIAMPISALVTAFGKNSAVKTILRIVIYVVIMAAYMYAMYSLGFFTGSDSGNFFDNPEVYVRDVVEGFAERLQGVVPYFHSDYMLMSSMVARSFGAWASGFFIAVGENIALIALVFLVSLPFYRSMLAMSVEGVAARRKKAGNNYKVQNKGVVREFMRNDFKKVVRDAQVGFQSFAGIIMMPVIVLILYFFIGLSSQEDASFLQVVSISPLYQVIAPMVILAYMTFIGCSTNVLGLYPISRENKSLYILKSLPIPFGKILLAKVLLATAVMLLSDFLSCLLIVLLFGVKWYYGLAMLAVMALVGFGSMCVTTLLDLKQPRLGWDNFNQSLKNAKNSWIAMLVSFLCVIALSVCSAPFIVLYSLFGGWYYILIMWLLDLGLGATFTTVAYKVMNGKAAKYFERIEV